MTPLRTTRRLYSEGTAVTALPAVLEDCPIDITPNEDIPRLALGDALAMGKQIKHWHFLTLDQH